MLKLETVMTEKTEVTDVLCNMCGKSTRCPIGNFEHVTCYVNWGYSSSRDMTTEIAHLCESCWEKISQEFKISPNIKDTEIDWR